MCHIWAAQRGLLLLLEHEQDRNYKLFTPCVQNQTRSNRPPVLCCLRGQEATMRLDWRDAVRVHFSHPTSVMIVLLMPLHCMINNGGWTLWETFQGVSLITVITQHLSLGSQSAVGLNCRHSSVSLQYWKTQWDQSAVKCLMAFIPEWKVKEKKELLYFFLCAYVCVRGSWVALRIKNRDQTRRSRCATMAEGLKCFQSISHCRTYVHLCPVWGLHLFSA